MRKLKYREVKEVREQMLEEQNYKCALCGEPIIDLSEAVLDHDHYTGRIRSVLHRGCNVFLSRIENGLTINRITPTRLAVILNNTISYINTSPKELIHPTHKTKEPTAKRNNNGNKSNSTKPKTRSSTNTSK
jgi:hypothetical protein